MIYVVAVGEYEECHDTLATTNINKAIDYIISIKDQHNSDNEFAGMDVWSEEKRIADYDFINLDDAIISNKDIRQDILDNLKGKGVNINAD